MSRIRDVLFGLTMFGLVVTIAQCGGGGGDSGNQGGGQTTATTNLFFTQPIPPASQGIHTLYAVDPASPSTKINVADNLIDLSPVVVTSGTYAPGTMTYNGYQAAWVVFARTDGRLYRVNARRGASLAPIQMSDESSAGSICNMTTVTDPIDPLKSVLVYRLTGPDLGCLTADDLLRTVRIDAASTQAPASASSNNLVVRETLYDFATGGILGVLADTFGGAGPNGASFCDPYLASCIVLAAPPSPQIQFLGQFRDTGKAAIVSNGALCLFNPADNTLGAPLFTFRTDRIQSMLDGSSLFFTDNDCLYSISSTASGPTLLDNVASREQGFEIRSLLLTAGKAVYDAGNGSAFAVFAIPRIGGTPLALGRSAIPTNLDAVRGGWVYYSAGEFYDNNAKAFRVLDDNTAFVEEANAKWIGQSLPANPSMSLSYFWAVAERVVLLKQPAAGPDLTGATVSSIDAASGASPVVLGTLARGIQDNSIDGLRIYDWPRGPMLGRGQYNGTYQDDLLYMDPLVAGSLLRLTETPPLHERPVY
jgi:hypothetical protein